MFEILDREPKVVVNEKCATQPEAFTPGEICITIRIFWSYLPHGKRGDNFNLSLAIFFIFSLNNWFI